MYYYSYSVTVKNCQSLLRSLFRKYKTVCLQWIPAHCGIEGNEEADLLAKKRAAVTQTTNDEMPFHNVKSLIKTLFKKNLVSELSNKNSRKSGWGKVSEISD